MDLEVRDKTQPVVQGSHARPGFGSQTVRAMAMAQFVLGVLCIIAGVVDNLSKSILGEVGHGIWGGIVFISTGICGVYVASNKSTKAILIYTVLSLVSIMVGIIAFGLTVNAVASETERISCDPAISSQHVTIPSNVCKYDNKAYHVVVDAILLLFELLVTGASVWGAYAGARAVWPIDLERHGQAFHGNPAIIGENGATTSASFANHGHSPNDNNIVVLNGAAVELPQISRESEMQPVETNGPFVLFKREGGVETVRY